MLNQESTTVKIPLNTPDFSLMFLAMEQVKTTRATISDALSTTSASRDNVCQVVKSSTIKATELPSFGRELFFDDLELCNLSELDRAFCRRASTVFNITAQRNSTSFFAPFWACHAFVEDLADKIDSIIVDMAQGNIVTTNGADLDTDAFGIPLTATFLTIKAYPKENAPNRYFLCTEGMSRFGLPELNLPEVPSNLAADGAYLLRTIAQFIWSKMEHVHPEQPYLELDSEQSISAVFCEYGNAAFHAANEMLIPFALELFGSQTQPILVVHQPDGYDDYYDWFLSINEMIVEHRLDIQRSSMNEPTHAVAAILAA